MSRSQWPDVGKHLQVTEAWILRLGQLGAAGLVDLRPSRPQIRCDEVSARVTLPLCPAGQVQRRSEGREQLVPPPPRDHGDAAGQTSVGAAERGASVFSLVPHTGQMCIQAVGPNNREMIRGGEAL